ncbi:MAG: hypothetical protein LBB84_07745 [Tannerellaceae bacterium]|jgi:hypothetical protein|nr:hypothetical protein [Tannerellaceae bacterium]
MKKILFILLAVAGFLSCEGPKETGVETQWKAIYYTVKEDDWQLQGVKGGTNSYYQFVFDEPALTDFIYTEGIVIGYQVIDPGTADEVLRPLPDTWPVGEKSSYWTESISFDYMPGSVAFYVGYSDFATNILPSTMTFKLMMIW